MCDVLVVGAPSGLPIVQTIAENVSFRAAGSPTRQGDV